ncbi:MAG: hypothetical protein ACK5LT_02045 [Lachnospirales bacterium]
MVYKYLYDNNKKAILKCRECIQLINKKFNLFNVSTYSLKEEELSCVNIIGTILCCNSYTKESNIVFNNLINKLEFTYFNDNFHFLKEKEFVIRIYLSVLNNLANSYYEMGEEYLDETIELIRKGINISRKYTTYYRLANFYELKFKVEYRRKNIYESKKLYNQLLILYGMVGLEKFKERIVSKVEKDYIIKKRLVVNDIKPFTTNLQLNI